ncbi:hypothetical protein AVEN_237378-1 [Araneus ventricosus]|uniref:Uncharacterized protein n=1 Tax=Araneus ventricosus TaxID=182803 RepID=A0A4Y2GW93_ARAVE|nr:hypothetical protein AVEN_237378-1 [Araneus ventricosus]
MMRSAPELAPTLQTSAPHQLAAEENIWRPAGLDDDRNYVERRYLRDLRDFARDFNDVNDADAYSDDPVKMK